MYIRASHCASIVTGLWDPHPLVLFDMSDCQGFGVAGE